MMEQDTRHPVFQLLMVAEVSSQFGRLLAPALYEQKILVILWRRLRFHGARQDLLGRPIQIGITENHSLSFRLPSPHGHLRVWTTQP